MAKDRDIPGDGVFVALDPETIINKKGNTTEDSKKKSDSWGSVKSKQSKHTDLEVFLEKLGEKLGEALSKTTKDKKLEVTKK
jgi:hypothetical protein